MARGFPDYFGQPQFPHYGTALRLTGNTGLILPGAGAYLFDISTKGKILYGNVKAEIAAAVAPVIFSLWVDGNCLGSCSVDVLLLHNHTVKDTETFYLTSYNQETKIFNMGISPGITFGKRIYVYVSNASLGNVNTEGYFYYYKIE